MPIDIDVVFIDIRDLISIDDVMDDEELRFGPNGGLIFCMEYVFHCCRNVLNAFLHVVMIYQLPLQPLLCIGYYKV